MNLYNLHNKPKTLHGHGTPEASTQVPLTTLKLLASNEDLYGDDYNTFVETIKQFNTNSLQIRLLAKSIIHNKDLWYHTPVILTYLSDAKITEITKYLKPELFKKLTYWSSDDIEKSIHKNAKVKQLLSQATGIPQGTIITKHNIDDFYG